MAVVCKCGQVADEQDRECSLCGRELPRTESDSAAAGGTGRQGDQETDASPVGAQTYPAPQERRRRQSGSLIPALLGGIVTLLLVAGILLVVDRQPVSGGPPTVPAVPATPTVEHTTVGASEPTIPTAEPTPPSTPVQPSEAAAPWSPLSPPARADEQSDDTAVVSDAAATPCRETSGTVYGGYPAASCNLWKTPVGLLHEEPITKGPRRVACQRDLEVDNPVYAAKQTNTWWIWTTSQTGTWDWYPETAIKQGASDQPVNGVALCHR